jgi:hypothetical protein
MVVQEAKAKELNDKVVTEATVAVATTGDAVQLAQLEKKLEVLLIPLHCRQLRIVLLLLKIN